MALDAKFVDSGQGPAKERWEVRTRYASLQTRTALPTEQEAIDHFAREARGLDAANRAELVFISEAVLVHTGPGELIDGFDAIQLPYLNPMAIEASRQRAFEEAAERIDRVTDHYTALGDKAMRAGAQERASIMFGHAATCRENARLIRELKV